MENQETIITVVVYNILLIGIGFLASKRNQTNDDFYLGNRGLGPWVAALSASASSSSAWTLLGVSGLAYSVGLGAVWILPGVLFGYFVSWTWIAPKLMELSKKTGAVSLPQLLFHDFDESDKKILMRLSTIIITSTLILYVAAQFQAAGTTFATILGISQSASVILGALVILIYTFIGGFWAVSLTDSIQAVLMFCIAIFLPLLLLMVAGGFSGVNHALEAIGTPEENSLTGVYAGMLGIGFIIGNISIGFGYPGQPFVVNRFMAAKDINTIKRGKYIAMFWALIIFSGMILLGLTAKVMYSTVSNPETVLFFVSERLFGPIFAGIISAAVLSAIMSTADSQLLTVATSVDNDWNDGKNKNISSARLAIIFVVIAATLFSLFAPDTIFDRVIFAWTAVGAAFVPMVLSKVFGWSVSGKAALLSVLCGFILTIVLHFFPDTPGDIVERTVPMALGLITLYVSKK